MRYDEISNGSRYSYTKECERCLLVHEILTQEADFQEYDTNVFLKCQCGEFLEFVLPVN